MNWRDVPIVRKLGLMLAFNTLIAVLSIALVFTVGTAIARIQDTQEQLQALAAVVGENNRAAMAFNDPESARKNLEALRVRDDIDTAVLYDSNGVIFVKTVFEKEFAHTGSVYASVLHTVLPLSLKVYHEIKEGDTPIGRIELRAHLHHLWMDMLVSLGWMVLIATALAALALYFGMRLRRTITDPLLALAQTTTQVSRESNYAIRATRAGNDEIGRLVDHFNRMLAEIQTRDEALTLEREALQARTAEMKLAKEAAERANKVKSEFLSTVSHELRTPLTAIAGSVGLIAGGALGRLPDQIAQMLNIAHKNSQRLTFLINDLLDMEKLMAGKLHFDMQGQALMPLVEQALVDNQAYAEQYGVNYVLTERADGVRVEVDAQRLQQVLANLLSNAAKFSPSGARVEISVIQRKGRVRVEVRDHGAGIPADFHAHIFQKFSQADASDTRKKGGTGLGLAITRELVEHMGGQIGFESVPEEGSCFHFDFPVWNSLVSRPAPLPSPEMPGNGARVLVVEDDADVACVLSSMLARAGYQVDTVATGTEALARAQSNAYAAMTLDLVLPDMNGVQVIELLRLHPATHRLPVVVVAAKPEAGRLALSPYVRGIEWLAKPIDQSRLLASLARLTLPVSIANPRVLHVEDDLDMHQTVRSMAGKGFDIELATSLREARARVSLERFDAVILDLTLPNESGWDLLPAIRAQQPDARVVVLSSADLAPREAQQVDAVLHKTGLSARQLVDAIDNRAPTVAETGAPS